MSVKVRVTEAPKENIPENGTKIEEGGMQKCHQGENLVTSLWPLGLAMPDDILTLQVCYLSQKIFHFVSFNLIQIVFLLLLTQGDLISKLYILPKGELVTIWLRNLDFVEIHYSTMHSLPLSLQCQVHYLPLLRP